MNSLLFTYIVLFIAVSVFVTAMFALSRYLDKRDDFADVMWGSIFIVIAVIGYLVQARNVGSNIPTAIITGLVIVWGARLTLHIGSRFIRSKGEDERYIELRKKWDGNVAVNSYFRIFYLQGLLALLIAAPVIFINTYTIMVSWIFYTGVSIWLIGFLFETISDFQLKQFIKKPSSKGKLLTTGLWHYSRHPNYFGEVTQWWGLGVIALAVPYGYAALLGPALLTFLIMKVSGVPPAEARAEHKPGWSEYRNHTSVLIPRLPNK